MNRDQKAAVIEEIAADITASQAIFAIDYRGITVAQAEELRTRLRGVDASFRVVKNSLTERAADQVGADQLKTLLQGPTALTFVRGDAAAAAKAIADFARVTQLLPFKGGVMDGATLTPTEVGVISRLPSRDVLYGQLVGLVASPIAGLARALNSLIGGLAIGLGAVLAQREDAEGPAAPAAPAGASAEETVASEGAPDADASGVAAAAEQPHDVAEPLAAVAEDAPVEDDGLAAASLGDASVGDVAEPEGVVEAEEASAEPEAVAEPEVEAVAEPEVEAVAEPAAEDAPAAAVELETDDESAPAASGDDEEKE
jgi:large subunit ribosomal protein L10